ncbi:MAG: hypothetical protein Q7R39_13350 [Dehalococcoidia bacterium]|nr:hypothetical protein [Dehalococcoidia bacterium]
MSLVKVRRDGNSLAITIPANEAREAHLEEGMYVQVEIIEESSSLSIHPVSIQPRVRPDVIATGRRVLSRQRGLYKRLASYDGDSS